ncbi:MAG TPA: hypothetical protein VFU21_01805 [Kofleriaceae bacterium]|nr:hypothetical protein [Kofleriaceae bacterium]
MTTPPDWLVERAALGEVPAASRDRLRAADPAELAARIERLRQLDAEELRRHPAAPAVAQIEAAVARVRSRRAADRRRSRTVLAATAAALVGGLVIVGLIAGRTDEPAPTGATPAGDPHAGDPVETTRIKGDVRLLAFRKAGDRIERLASGAVVRAGDVIQLRFNGGGRRHGVIASIDGAGAVTLHFPLSEDAPTALGDRTTDLPHAYALDDAPRFERFFFITDDRPIDVAGTLAALRALAARPGADRALLDLPPGSRQLSLILHKAPHR